MTTKPGVDVRETGIEHDENPAESGDDFLDEYRAYLEEYGPKKSAVREQIVTLLEELRQRGPLATGDLKDVLEAEVGKQYQDRKSMWESYNRHLKTLPGFEKAGYGEWDFEGEEETREQL